MQGSIEHLQTGGSNGLETNIAADFFKQVSALFSESTDLEYFLLLAGISLIFIVLLVFFRTREQKNDEFFYIPVEKYSIDCELSSSEEKKPEQTQRSRKKGLLESAYQPEWDYDNISPDPLTKHSSLECESSDPLESVEEIRKINQCTREQRINDFQELSTDIQASDTQLMDEFEKIHNNDKLDAFIEEFEYLLKEMNNRTETLLDSPENMDNLIQFKSSIQFIKVLSEMMQARCLNRFSFTVAEFLEGVIDGQIRITGDTGKRLHKVVKYYNQYGQYLKHKPTFKISA